jgi:hypothetical protein
MKGHRNIQPWIDTSLAALQTPSAKRLAQEALNQNSVDWVERAKQDRQGPAGRGAAPSYIDQGDR